MVPGLECPLYLVSTATCYAGSVLYRPGVGLRFDLFSSALPSGQVVGDGGKSFLEIILGNGLNQSKWHPNKMLHDYGPLG